MKSIVKVIAIGALATLGNVALADEVEHALARRELDTMRLAHAISIQFLKQPRLSRFRPVGLEKSWLKRLWNSAATRFGSTTQFFGHRMLSENGIAIRTKGSSELSSER